MLFRSENTLIKRHRPRYNVRLRDDKAYLCIRVDVKHRWPRIHMVRRFRKDGALYFGPYSSAGSIRATLNLLNSALGLRVCRDRELYNRARPCPLQTLKFVSHGHNTIRGAAGAAILNAELMHREGLL